MGRTKQHYPVRLTEEQQARLEYLRVYCADLTARRGFNDTMYHEELARLEALAAGSESTVEYPVLYEEPELNTLEDEL